MGFIGEQVKGMFHWESCGSFTVNTPGPAFRDLVTGIRRAGYRVQVDTISTSRVPQQLDAPPLPQFRERVIIVATQHGVAALMGPFHVAAFHAKHRPVGDLLRAQALHLLSIWSVGRERESLPASSAPNTLVVTVPAASAAPLAFRKAAEVMAGIDARRFHRLTDRYLAHIPSERIQSH
jgi:site-specific DNA-cytosine methylase